MKRKAIVDFFEQPVVIATFLSTGFMKSRRIVSAVSSVQLLQLSVLISVRWRSSCLLHPFLMSSNG